MELWNSRELCKAVNGKSLDNSSWQANSISIDTRSIKDGGVFFALKGNKVDGIAFGESLMSFWGTFHRRLFLNIA